MEATSLADLELAARASLPETHDDYRSVSTDKESAAPATDKTPAQKVQETSQQPPAGDPATEKAKEPEATETEKVSEPKKDEPTEKKESDFVKKQNEFQRKEKSWTQINERKEQVTQYEGQVAQREQALRQKEQEFNQRIQQAQLSKGKLPDYKSPDGQMYPAATLEKFVIDASAAGEEGQARDGLKELVALARQAGALESYAPSQEQVSRAVQTFEIAAAKRPELAIDSGKPQGEVLKTLFNDPDYRNFIARRPDGINESIALADLCAKGMGAEVRIKALETELADLKRSDGEKAEKVAHLEKATAPARAGVTRKPTPKTADQLSTTDLEATIRQQEASGALKWG